MLETNDSVDVERALVQRDGRAGGGLCDPFEAGAAGVTNVGDGVSTDLGSSVILCVLRMALRISVDGVPAASEAPEGSLLGGAEFAGVEDELGAAGTGGGGARGSCWWPETVVLWTGSSSLLIVGVGDGGRASRPGTRR
jgi:hypothetical protein